MTQLILIRHGETDWNRELRFQGHIDVPLNAAGRLQAQRLGEALAREQIAAIYCSDLLRARETADPAARLLALPIHPEPGLREQGFGMLEGMSGREIRQQHPQIWADWSRHDADYAAPGGESARSFHARVLSAVRQLAAAHRGQTLLIVTHGGALDMVWRSVKGLPLHGARDCAIPNCGINRLHLDGESLRILRWADDAHLQGLPEQPSTVPASVAFAASEG